MHLNRLAGRLSRLTLVLLASAASIPLLAQQPTLESEAEMMLDLIELLDTPVTTATKTAVKLRNVPAAVTVITRQDIQRYGYRSLDQALSRVPEVYTHYSGQNNDADFRGFYANNVYRRVLYLLNGHRLNDRFHFGDFLPDTIQDLSNVEQIEVIRGPGAALYGSVAMLGVVNIITRDAKKAPAGTTVTSSVSAEELGSGSLTTKLAAGFTHRWSKDVGLALDLNWFDGEVRYDTQTAGTPRPWKSAFSQDGPGIANVTRTTDYYTEVPGSYAGGSDFRRGKAMPNFTLQLNVYDFTLGAFLHTRRSSWVWPKDNVSFNAPENDRSWGTSAIYLDWKPTFAAQWDLSARVSYNWNTNREQGYFSATQYVLDANGAPTATSLFMNRIINGIANGNAFIDGTGTNYRDLVNPALKTDAAAMAHGGGGIANYAGVDKSLGFEFQLSPIKTDSLTVSLGGNYEKANYVNKQWVSMQDGTFIAWSNFGGIKDNGYYWGLWVQAIWNPIKDLTITAGARSDKQVIQDVYRELGGDKVLWRAVPGQPGVYEELRSKNKVSTDFTPRVAVNWNITETSNLRAIYAEAFRAVPPQEVIRLPRDFGDAESEKLKDYELIYSTALGKAVNLNISAFQMKGNVVYAFSPVTSSFNKGSGWSNTGLTLDLRYQSKGGVEAWGSATYYSLKRATDAFGFMKDYKVTPNVPLPNMDKPLDSPGTLAKVGCSYKFTSRTLVATEVAYNGSITTIRPVNLNPGDPNPATPGQPNYLEHKVPSSVNINVNLRQDLDFLGMKGAFAVLKVTNLLDSKNWGVLNMDMQGFSSNTYWKPTQQPGFGRLFMFQVGYTF